MNLGSILLWGLMATVVLTTIMAASQGLGLTRMSMPFILGTMFTPDRNLAGPLGFGVHVLNGWLFALLYALAFEQLGRATWWLGAGIGLVHGLFVLVAVMSIIPGLHPRMASEQHGPTPTRQLQPPGFMALHYGRRTPAVTLLAHLAYGTLLGALYGVGG
jgi:hypothetical protein